MIVFPDLVMRVGTPDEVTGKGVYLYRLSDGSLVYVFSADAQKIDKIMHVIGSTQIQVFPHHK